MLPFTGVWAWATPTDGSPGRAASDAPTVSPIPLRKSRRFTSAMCVPPLSACCFRRQWGLPIAPRRPAVTCGPTTVNTPLYAPILSGMAFVGALRVVARGIRRAVRARHGGVALTALAVLALDVLLPPLLLSVVRKPWTFFTFNPWLKRIPEYLVSATPWSDKLDFLSRVALFWVSADGPYGQPEWGFAVDGADVVRFVVTALLVAVYVALWLERRAVGVRGWRAGAGRAGGTLSACAGVLGLSTGPCSVVGCGAPVMPVVGLAFA